MTKPVQFVAHRGEPDAFPENSLESFAHALRSGAAYLETDVQLSADGVVVLSHDENLRRLTGKDIDITQNAYGTFRDVPAGYREKFHGQFDHCRIATLKQFADLVQCRPGVICFIEIKPESLACFGPAVIERVLESLQAIAERSVLISFDYDALVLARQKYHKAIGWVLPEWSPPNRSRAEALAPDYLFVAKEICPRKRAEIWQGPWQWVVYTLDDPAEIKKFTALGIDLIETNCISRMTDAVKDDAGN